MLEADTPRSERLSPSRRRGFILRVVLPAVLAVILFILAIFLILIPRFEDELLAGKQETTQELTRAAISILDGFHEQETSGALTQEEAQTRAAAAIEQLRWGEQGLDYYWITDMHPTMIMHPYLPELNGQDLTTYEDQAGNTLFVDMVEVVEAEGSGFVEYYWQFQDDPTEIVQKLSYVEEFAPWGRVVGTGIYVDDVNAAISAVERNLIYISIAIVILTALLLLYGIRQSLKIEKRREVAEEGLKESHEKYRALVEAATEGLLMSLDGKATYFNKPFLDMLGYGPEELAGTDAEQLFVTDTDADREALAPLAALSKGEMEGVPPTFEARLRTKDGVAVEALLAATSSGSPDLASSALMLDTASLRLSRLGEAVPFHVEPRSDRFVPGSTLFFLAEGTESAYANEAVYELALAPGGIQMGGVLPTRRSPPTNPLALPWSLHAPGSARPAF
jgi:PAS domain S-box-containing protein